MMEKRRYMIQEQTYRNFNIVFGTLNIFAYFCDPLPNAYKRKFYTFAICNLMTTLHGDGNKLSCKLRYFSLAYLKRGLVNHDISW